MEIIRSDLFSRFDDIVLGVSTRNGGVSAGSLGLNLSYNVGDIKENVDINRRRFFAKLGIQENAIAFPGQVHGDCVREAQTPGRVQDCDALVTATPALYLAVSIADCLPVLLYDSSSSSIAAVHSGWKGSKLNIVSKTLRYLIEHHGSDPKNVIAFLGPSAGACCYEVGEEVAQNFDPSFVHRIQGKQKPHLDLKAFNKSLLRSAGVRDENIEVSTICTICSSDIMHSYRRDGNTSGRMLAVIGRKGKNPFL